MLFLRFWCGEKCIAAVLKRSRDGQCRDGKWRERMVQDRPTLESGMLNSLLLPMCSELVASMVAIDII